jgi:hypothetical protein
MISTARSLATFPPYDPGAKCALTVQYVDEAPVAVMVTFGALLVPVTIGPVIQVEPEFLAINVDPSFLKTSIAHTVTVPSP